MKRLRWTDSAAWTLGIVALVAVNVAIMWHDERKASAANLGDVRVVPNWSKDLVDGQVLGIHDAPVQAVLYMNYECDRCRSVARVLSRLVAMYPQQLNVVVRHWPSDGDADAFRAGVQAECAGAQGRFAAFHQILISEQGVPGAPPEELARRARVSDLPLFLRCLGDPAIVATIRRDVVAAQSSGAAASPFVIVKGVGLFDRRALSNVARIVQLAVSTPTTFSSNP